MDTKPDTVYSTESAGKAATARDSSGDWLGDSEPGGCECHGCGRIFIGSEWRTRCKVCVNAAFTGSQP